MQPCFSCPLWSQRLYPQLIWCWHLRWSLPSLQFPLPVQPHVHFARSLLHQFHLHHQFCSHPASPSPSHLIPLAGFWGSSLLPIILCLRGCTRTSFLSSHVQFWQSQWWRQGVTRMWEERNKTSGENGKTLNQLFPVRSSSSVRRLDQRLPEILFNLNYLRFTFFLTILTNVPPILPLFPVVWITLRRQGKLYSADIKSL